MTKLIIFKANLIKLLDNKKLKSKFSAIFNPILKNYTTASILLSLHMDRQVLEKHIRCLEVTGIILYKKMFPIKNK